MVAFVTCLVMGPIMIPALQKLKFGQVIRYDGPQSHLKKKGTPTMGGFILMLGMLAGTMVLMRWGDPNLGAAAVCIGGFALVGFLDDMLKIRRKNSTGLRGWYKIILQTLIAGIITAYLYTHIGTQIRLPFTSQVWDMGLWYIPFTMFVLLATVNSVQLTDGLDGLASGVSLIYFVSFALIFALEKTAYSENMMILCGALAGACLGFLRFNVFPARVFMGDTGSMALGGAVTFVALVSKTALWIPVMGACYVASSLSDIIQVGSYKLRNKRVFKMAPLHHHFELLGMPETRVVSMYMIVTTILCLIGLLAI
jgi:phospho-N-acetylmuramoyl-pentapeptide-transferase